MSAGNLRWLTQSPVLWVIALGITMLTASPAATMAAGGEAGEADEFLRYGSNVRSLGMGRAYVALADDASALYHNPAGLIRLTRGYSVYGMHFRPFYESNYNFVSLAISRPDPTATGLKNIFLGPSAAWGFAIVHLGSDGYEQRDDNDNLVDEDFGLYQQAFMLAFAREAAGSAGILNYGATFKVVRHGVSDATSEYNNSESSVGLDLGAQLQMINPPLVKELTRVPLIGTFFQLKHLMPLRLGVNIRNVISPKLGYGGKADKYPTALRVGASYRLPSDWLLQNSGVLLVSDYEWLFDDMDRLIRLSRRVSFSKIAPGAGQYFGTEFQYQTEKLKLSPRFGLSHVYNDWKFSTGFGVAFEASGMDFQFDFAHGYHENLADDQRISLTIRFGGKRDADYFVDPWQIRPIVSPDTMWSIDPCEPPVEPLADESDESADTVTSPGTNLSRRSTALRVVSGFPDLWEEALPAAVTLARELDTANADRYLELVGGPLLAVNLAERAIGTFQIDRRGEASRVALEAIARFEELVAESPDIMGDYFNVLLGQCEMINAATVEGAAANGAWSRAADLLYRALDNVQCLKLHFLIGTCHQKEKDFTRAAEQFQKGLETSDADSQSMRTLSRLLLGEALLNSNHADSAIAVLSKLTQSQTLPMASLSADYPRYWTFDDMRVPDDAQYFIARCYLSLNDDSRAAAEFVKICRFYPGSDKCEEAAVETNQAVQKLLNR